MAAAKFETPALKSYPVIPLVAEGAMAHFLHAEDVLDLPCGQHALLDQQLPDLDSFSHSELRRRRKT